MLFINKNKVKKKSANNSVVVDKGAQQVFDKTMDRRTALRSISQMLATGAGIMAAARPTSAANQAEVKKMEWDEYFKGNFRLMTDEEKSATIERITALHKAKTGQDVSISSAPAREGVLYGYAFNISKCEGYMDCVSACKTENNLDHSSGMQYIDIHESKNGSFSMSSSNNRFYHEVPAEGNFYFGTQCFHCANPPCVKVCPVGATWAEPDGLVVIDYDWCIGCRYCEAACPYFGRRFNWKDPEVPTEEINPDQHYLGNRMRKKGVMEKCTFCIQRTRNGKNPACVEACPTGARIFGNLLDPESEIRWVLANKKVFRLKEDLGAEPKYWYYMD